MFETNIFDDADKRGELSAAGQAMGKLGIWLLHLTKFAFLVYSGGHGISAALHYAGTSPWQQLAQIVGVVVIVVVVAAIIFLLVLVLVLVCGLVLVIALGATALAAAVGTELARGTDNARSRSSSSLIAQIVFLDASSLAQTTRVVQVVVV